MTQKGAASILPLTVSYAVLPEKGEDSFAIASDQRGSLLCVADGCGGLGSRRYSGQGEQTGAYLAARLVTAYVRDWASQRSALPKTREEGQAWLDALNAGLSALLSGFAAKNGLLEGGSRIVGSMQRALPSTLCAALTRPEPEGEKCCFLWAGDSRGYVLDESGMHQYTKDDIRARLDPFDSLYLDAPLTRCLSADQPIRLHLRRAGLKNPSVLICATDGVYGCLPTPMEFEMLLLSTMEAAGDESAWQRKLEHAIRQLATDDATLLCRPRGFEAYGDMKQYFKPRLEALKAAYIHPVRRQRQNREVARDCWSRYRPDYDRTEETPDVRDDWLL